MRLLWLLPSFAALGLFQSSGDIGVTPLPGSAVYQDGAYRITGGGANMWGREDALHFVWKQMSGDFSLQADVRFEGAGVDAHRKAALLVRQDLTPGSPYADVAVHGDGLTSLQFRAEPGGLTQEVKSGVSAPERIRIERRGHVFTMYAAKAGVAPEETGSQEVKLEGPVYVGLGVCSHNANVLETAIFTNVRIETLSGPGRGRNAENLK